MAAPTFIAGTTSVGASTSEGSLALNVAPSGRASGDLLLAWVWASVSSVVWATPAGWTQVASQVDDTNEKTALFYKISDGTETTQTFTLSSGTAEVGGHCFAYRGVNPTNPINVSTSGWTGVATSSTVMPSVTTTVDNALLLCLPSSDENAAGSYGTPTGMTSRMNQQNVTTLRLMTFALFDQAIATAGATGTKTSSSNGTYGHSYFVLALAPPTEARVYNESVEVLGAGTPDARVFNQSVEVLVSAAVGSQTVSPAAIASAGAVGTPTITKTATVSPSGITTGTALGAPAVSRGAAGPQTISPAGIGSGGAVGAPILDPENVVTNVRVGFYVTHTYRSDLKISLVSPAGTTAVLTSGTGGSIDNFGVGVADSDLTTLDDAAGTTFASLGSASGAGSFRPDQSLSAFNLSALYGSWELRFLDQAAADVGNVRAAVLFITTADGVAHRVETTTTLPLAIPDDETTTVAVAFGFAPPAPAVARAVSINFTDRADLYVDLRTGTPDGTVADQPETVTQAFLEAWQGAALTPGAVPGEDITVPPQHVGNKRPKMKVMVRNGRFNRDHRSWNNRGYPVGATVAGSNKRPWQATWHPNNAYRELPNVEQVDLGKNFDENGVQTATIQVANIVYPANAGGGHNVKRGYMAPLRGYDPPSLPSKHPPHDLDGTEVIRNDWGSLFDRKVQVTIFQTYGDAPWVKVFTGIVDDVDTTSRPDVLTLTARDFGETLVESHIFGWNKDPKIKGPVTFIGREEAESISHVGYNAQASSSFAKCPASDAIDGDLPTYWRSDHGTTANRTEWVEFRVREGFYENIFLDARFTNDGHLRGNYDDMYVSIYAKPLSGGASPTVDGTPLTANAWVSGPGTVPGGGPSYIKHVSSPGAAGAKRPLDGRYKLGDDSIIRISFRGLTPIGSGYYAAGVRETYAYRELITKAAKKAHWIIVDDISDVVKVLLRWAGFKEWEVESTGAELPRRLIFHPDDTYMSAIRQVADAIGYTFFVKDPSPWGNSLGIPVFRKSWALVNDGAGRNRRLTVNDRTSLTGITIRESDDQLRYTIRTRGRITKKGEIGNDLGYGGPKRLLFFYRPPWVGALFPWDGKLGGVIKHAVYKNDLWKTRKLCRFAAYDIALKEAMAATSGTVEFAGNPAIDLDEHVLFSDLGTGAITRLAVYSRTSSFVTGENAKWTMSVSGSLVDTPDVQSMVTIINDESNN